LGHERSPKKEEGNVLFGYVGKQVKKSGFDSGALKIEKKA
jgi:hypothetical protein